MKAGFSKVSILPKKTGSLAGYTNKMPRFFTHVHDEPFARGLALEDDGRGVIVISADILTPTDRLAQATKLAVRGRVPAGVDIVLHGTHTHSGPGNYWSHPVAKRFAGPFWPEAFDFLARRFADLAESAWRAREPVRVGFGQDALSGLQENRRRADGLRGGPVGHVRRTAPARR